MRKRRRWAPGICQEEKTMENGKGKLQGREVVIVEAVRTPVGRGHLQKGYYKDLHPSNLLARTYAELIDRSGIDPAEVGDVIAGATPGSRRGSRSRSRRPRLIGSAALASRQSTSRRRWSPPASTTWRSAAASSTWAKTRSPKRAR
jgi:hypothetical protein